MVAARKAARTAVRKRYLFRRLFSWCWGRAHWIFPVVAAIVIFRGQIDVLEPSLLPNGDNTHHLMSQFAVLQSYTLGDAIWGPQSFDYGMPLFRFYQPLFYLVCLGLHILTDASPMLLHVTIMALFFSASPLSLCFGLRKIGLPRFAAGFASLFAMTSVAGFGNSIEAYHGNGIVTQSLAAFFFPLFIGTFADFLRGRARVTIASVLFALTFLSHVVMAVLAVLAGALYFLVVPFSVRRIWKRVAVFSAFTVCLVAFWLVPFLVHTVEFRPIPDSEVRVDKRWWFVGATDDELSHLVASGRLFDDARAVQPRDKDNLDQLMDQLNIAFTRRVRPPVITMLTAWGFLVGLLCLRRPGARFLVAGLLFSLLLLAGQDDHPWLGFVPFINYVQSFRCVYFVEFFAFGLIGLGIERTLVAVVRVASGFDIAGRTFAVIVVLAVAIGASKWATDEIAAIEEVHVRSFEPEYLDGILTRVAPVPKNGYPFRTDVTEIGGLMRDWLSINGFRMGITHWGKSGPNATFKAQAYLTAHRNNIPFSRLIGQRYLFADKQTAAKLQSGKMGTDMWRPVESEFASDPEQKASRYVFLDSGQDEFLQPLANRVVAVVCRHNQWIWLVDAWMERYGPVLEKRETPFPVRVPDTSFRGTELNELVDAVVYLDGSAAQRDASGIREMIRDGKKVLVPYAIDGVQAFVIPPNEPVWKAFEKADAGKKTRSSGAAAATVHRDADKKRTNQRYAFEIDALEPALALLPTVNVQGWNATLDGHDAPVFSAGPSLTAVAVPRGEHRLVFWWRMPVRDQFVGLLSAVMFVVLAAFWILGVTGDVLLRRSLMRTLRASRSR